MRRADFAGDLLFHDENDYARILPGFSSNE